ncbi:hypothetical protein KY285_000676 [Solanum tuberosum]|nr:hypothetical protein KY285_000676 [Solanum tuberosum]
MPKVELLRKNFILQTQLSGGVEIAHFNARHVCIDLDNEIDYNTVWTKQKMSIQGQLMRIQTWTPTFKPEEETPIVPIWVTLPELPWHCYNKEIVTALLSPIGEVLYLDTATTQKTRGSLARARMKVDLTQVRRPRIWIGYDEEDINIGRWQAVLYESVPDYCTYCKHQGHLIHVCTIKKRDEDQRKRREQEAEGENGKKEQPPPSMHEQTEPQLDQEETNFSTDKENKNQMEFTKVNWYKPPNNILKLNTDGSAIGNPGRIGGGGILRDHQGNMVYDFTIPLGMGTSNQAEIQTALFDMQWCSQHGYSNIILEVDSELLMKWIKHSLTPPWQVQQHLRQLQDIINQMTFFQCNHIYREANFTADALSKWSHTTDIPQQYYTYQQLPREIRGYFNRDKLGMATFRRRKLKRIP